MPLRKDNSLGIEDKTETTVTAAAIGNELRAYSRQRWPLANDKYRKSRLSNLLSLSHRRIKSFWEGEPTAVPKAEETRRIEALIGKSIGPAADGENRDDFMALQARVSRLEAALAAVDEAFFDPQMAAYREALHVGRGAHVSSAPLNTGTKGLSE
jgi:hypothetical protein